MYTNGIVRARRSGRTRAGSLRMPKVTVGNQLHRYILNANLATVFSHDHWERSVLNTIQIT